MARFDQIPDLTASSLCRCRFLAECATEQHIDRRGFSDIASAIAGDATGAERVAEYGPSRGSASSSRAGFFPHPHIREV